MTILRFLKRIFIALILLIALAAVVLVAAPWQSWVEARLKSYLEEKGVQNAEFTLKHVGFSQLTFADIKLEKPPVSLSNVTLDYALRDLWERPEGKYWTSAWTIKDVSTKNLGADIPPLDGKGTLNVTAEQVAIDGQLISADKNYHADFNYNYVLQQPEKSNLLIKHASMPWQGGTVGADNIKLLFNGKRSVRVNVEVQKVSLDALLQKLTGNRASGNGVISGIVPVVIAPDGSFTLDNGKLEGEGPGTIVMSPDAIPGDNEQVAMLRDVLKDFHYNLLSIEADSGADKKLSVLMRLEGNNPVMYEGKPLKLNVRLTGDVLNFVQQNLMSLTDPKAFLEQGTHAQP